MVRTPTIGKKIFEKNIWILTAISFMNIARLSKSRKSPATLVFKISRFISSDEAYLHCGFLRPPACIPGEIERSLHIRLLQSGDLVFHLLGLQLKVVALSLEELKAGGALCGWEKERITLIYTQNFTHIISAANALYIQLLKKSIFP